MAGAGEPASGVSLGSSAVTVLLSDQFCACPAVPLCTPPCLCITAQGVEKLTWCLTSSILKTRDGTGRNGTEWDGTE